MKSTNAQRSRHVATARVVEEGSREAFSPFVSRYLQRLAPSRGSERRGAVGRVVIHLTMDLGASVESMPTALEAIPVLTIEGQPSSLGEYSGKVRLVVNVASRCGLTPQYTGLEAMYRKYKDRGFEILGFPANEFGAQEPGTEQEISEFCSTEYDVTFPLFSKIVVKGKGQHPLYALLTREQQEAQKLPGSDFRAKLVSYGIDPGAPHEIVWNFEEFLVNRQGDVIARFAPDVTPDSDLLVSAIERELA